MGIITEELARESDLKRLREPFPPEAVSLKPIYVGAFEEAEGGRQRIPDAAWHACPTCGGYHPLPAKHVPYVGHARVTERLLEVDPEWSWEPLGRNTEGNPLAMGGSLWIRLTVCGVSRIGVGNAENWSGPDAHKEMVSDAIKNAAMRFGVGLEMWYPADSEVTWPPEEPEAPAPKPFEERLGSKPTAAQVRVARALDSIAAAGGDAEGAAELLERKVGRPFKRMTAPMADMALGLLYESHGDLLSPQDDDDQEVIPL